MEVFYGQKQKKERKIFCSAKQYLLLIGIFFYKNNVDFKWQNYSDLRRYKLGLVSGFVYSPEFKDAITKENYRVEYVNDLNQNISKLINNRIDATPMELGNGNYLIETFFNEHKNKISVNPNPLIKDKELYIIFSKQNTRSEELKKAFDKYYE